MKKYKTWNELKTEKLTQDERDKITKEVKAEYSKWKEIKRKKFSEEKCQEIRKRAEERGLEEVKEKNSPDFPEKEGKNGQQD